MYERKRTPPSVQAIAASQPDSAFRRGRRELLQDPDYDRFRNLLIFKFERAKREIVHSPECVRYAAVMMSNVEVASEVSADAGSILLHAVKGGADVKPALSFLAGVVLTDEIPHIRARAAEIMAEGAFRGNDISSAYNALGAALEDPSEDVRNQARRALEAAGQIS